MHACGDTGGESEEPLTEEQRLLIRRLTYVMPIPCLQDVKVKLPHSIYVLCCSIQCHLLCCCKHVAYLSYLLYLTSRLILVPACAIGGRCG